LGKVAGIEIRVHASFAILVVLFALAFSQPGAAGPLAGLTWLVIIFSCVVVHELAHSIVARRRGAVVHEILLLPIGGVSKLEQLPGTPSDEFAIAIAGPLASAAIAGAGAALATAMGVRLLPVDLLSGSLLSRLVWFNLIVAGFNLLPAFPLDGGRVLRAWLERRLDLETATRHAARIGRWLAVSLAVTGLLVDVWLVVIGVFVYLGASAEEAATIVHARIGRLDVRDAMLVEPLVLEARTRTGDLGTFLRRTPQRIFPVIGAQGYAGMVTADAIDGAAPAVCVADVADPDALSVAPDASLEHEAVPMLQESPCGALAVVDAGRVVGLLRIEDVVHEVERRAPAEEPGRGASAAQ
jgi:Zn-dependent protease